MICFQSTPPRRRRLRPEYPTGDMIAFQSTPPRRRRLGAYFTINTSHLFQSTPPRRRRHIVQCLPYACFFFNPRLREGGDVFPLGSAFQGLFFNPRLREGGDTNLPLLSLLYCFFNPRLREGGDLLLFHSALLHKFSIHASAKEATATYCNTPAIMCISSLNNFFVHHF